MSRFALFLHQTLMEASSKCLIFFSFIIAAACFLHQLIKLTFLHGEHKITNLLKNDAKVLNC